MRTRCKNTPSLERKFCCDWKIINGYFDALYAFMKSLVLRWRLKIAIMNCFVVYSTYFFTVWLSWFKRRLQISDDSPGSDCRRSYCYHHSTGRLYCQERFVYEYVSLPNISQSRLDLGKYFFAYKCRKDCWNSLPAQPQAFISLPAFNL